MSDDLFRELQQPQLMWTAWRPLSKRTFQSSHTVSNLKVFSWGTQRPAIKPRINCVRLLKPNRLDHSSQ